MPTLFQKYPKIFPKRDNQNLYKEPERFTSSEARQRRLFAELSRQRKELEVKSTRLSPANKFHLNKLKEFEVKFGARIEYERKRADAAVRRNPSIVRSLSYKAAMSRLLQLQQRRAALLQRAAEERRARLQARAVDSRSWNPDPVVRSYPRTKFGTDAWVQLAPGVRFKQMVRSAMLSLPCLDRMARREVMFAKKKAGRGYRVKHRKGPLSAIGC